MVHVLARVLALTAVGAALGGLAALWLSRLLATMLYQVDATSPIAFLGGIGIIASPRSSRRRCRRSVQRGFSR